MHRLLTRAYPPGVDANGDRLLSSLAADRRATLLAEPDADGLRFDVRLQGRGRRCSSVTRFGQTGQMTDLLWPGDDRAADVFTDDAVAMVAVEEAP